MSDAVKKVKERLSEMPKVEDVRTTKTTVEVSLSELKKDAREVRATFDESYLREKFDLQV